MSVIVEDRSYYRFGNSMLPPAPGLDVQISDSVKSKRHLALALIDSGADITCVSEEKIGQLETILGYPIMIQSVSVVDSKGKVVEEIQTYAICVILEDKYPYVPENGILTRDNGFFGEEDMLLGRDILNDLKVTLDGRNQSFDIEDPGVAGHAKRMSRRWKRRRR